MNLGRIERNLVCPVTDGMHSAVVPYDVLTIPSILNKLGLRCRQCREVVKVFGAKWVTESYVIFEEELIEDVIAASR